MRTLTKKTALALGIAVGALGGVLAGHAQQTSEPREAARMGAQMQKGGIMSQQDYVRVRALEHAVARSHTVSSTDLSWTLALLKRASDLPPK